MLKSLYDYAIRNDLVLPSGYVKKVIKAWILLYEDGTFQGIEMGSSEAIAVPDIGSLANSADKCNILREKRSVVIPEKPSAKSSYFLSTLRDAAEAEPSLSLCADALENEATAATIRQALDDAKIKKNDVISFKVNLQPIMDSPRFLSWWENFRSTLGKKNGSSSLCLITGQETVPLSTVSKVVGLRSVGGHASGDALICFDKSAFCSYGLKQGANAPVSEEAFSAANAALNELLEHAPSLAGMKFVHWFNRTLPLEEDPFASCRDFLGMDVDDDTEKVTGEESINEFALTAQANELVESVKSGKHVSMNSDVEYSILLLSGVSGRVMIRRWEQGNYAELKKRLEQWSQDLELVHPSGSGTIRSQKLSARLLRLMKYQSVDKNPFERAAKELSGLSPAILNAILSGGPLPDAVAVRALNYIRSSMLSVDDDGKNTSGIFGKDACVWQWLKVWLLRKNGRSENNLMSEYNPDYQGDAYHCGAQMALFEAIQNLADPNVNVTVAERYYASCIQTPALVLGRLSQLSQYHLAKVGDKYKSLAEIYREKLATVNASMEGKAPTTLTLTQQSEFALGYYQMHALLSREKNERIVAKKEKEAKN
ncbi:MAG: type I-C CRISPR-associated protein Cas8c/Csd1 [Clostridiales bacterium]|nr:type I-C CRISPR-associated protein Cas8c/Csd1 [Candidatus Apopatocola equi]